MPKTTKTTVNKNSKGQYQTTIPKPIADAMNLDGAKVEWEIESSKSLKLNVKEEDE